ncbi:hypothetical protein ACQEV2_41350 [Streptomyces sp. CA-251387]|uniref:hypothetical protein n=1 Tax=Streptomyces sp. CA-251387 TaxID=3240064 RepID=UPI003D8A0431
MADRADEGNPRGRDRPRGKDGGKPRDIEGPQDPVVEKFRCQPRRAEDRSEEGPTFNGFLGDSDRPGHRRLYFTRNFDYCIEFAVDDVVDSAGILWEQPPFIGAEATRITLRKGAEVSYACMSTHRPPMNSTSTSGAVPIGASGPGSENNESGPRRKSP